MSFILCLTLIINYVRKWFAIISSSKHQIGILKALGMKFKDLCSIFIYKNLIFTVISIVSTLLLAFPSFKIADVLLIESYSLFIRKSISERIIPTIMKYAQSIAELSE